MKKYEYQVLQIQNASVTFVNGTWQGLGVAEQAVDADEPLAGCPKLWDYLNEMGDQGWEMVASSPRHPEQVTVEVLYLMKEKFG